MSKKQIAAQDARVLMLSELRGVLSTHSQNMPGYPFGSVLPYCLDANGWPIIQVARISQHTRNIMAEPKVSLLIGEPGLDDVLTGKRLTIVGNAEEIEDTSSIEEHYYRLFPQGKEYQKAHDSVFLRIKPVRSRYIGGFAQAFWFDNELLFAANPFFGDSGSGVIRHMNEDHKSALMTYCRNTSIAFDGKDIPTMVSVDSEGMHLKIGQRVVWIAFSEVVTDRVSLRQELVRMAK